MCNPIIKKAKYEYLGYFNRIEDKMQTLPLDQGLFSVPALVFELAQLTSQKRFDGGYVIFEPSTTFLGTSYGQIVVAVFT